MNQKEFADLKNQIMLSIEVNDKNIEIFREILECCLERENCDTNLAINLKGGKGSINRYEMNFNLVVAIQLFLAGATGYGDGVNLKNGIMTILSIIAAITSKNNISLDIIKVKIIYVLYQMQERRERNPSEDELFNHLISQTDSNTLSRSVFDDEVEQLRELKCIDITEGYIKLIDKVRF